jgi:hypothetical protein
MSDQNLDVWRESSLFAFADGIRPRGEPAIEEVVDRCFNLSSNLGTYIDDSIAITPRPDCAEELVEVSA